MGDVRYRMFWRIERWVSGVGVKGHGGHGRGREVTSHFLFCEVSDITSYPHFQMVWGWRGGQGLILGWQGHGWKGQGQEIIPCVHFRVGRASCVTSCPYFWLGRAYDITSCALFCVVRTLKVISGWVGL